MSHVESDLADDLLFGVEAIAKYIGLGKRQAHHAIASGHLPVKRMGPRLIVSSKSALRRHFAVDDGKAS
jgi:hypothetical protein